MIKFTEIFNDSHIEALRYQLLFSGLSRQEIYLFILHADPLYQHLKSGESLRISDDYGRSLGVVFSGRANVYSVEYDGNRTLLNPLETGLNSSMLYGFFDYNVALLEFTSVDDCDILIIKPESLFIGEESLALIQQKILVNLIASHRETFLKLSDHITCLSQRTIKSKVMHYLRIEKNHHNSPEFSIPFSREELASFLAVDRAALSRALGELKKDGIIDFKKNRFILLEE
jgi:DNA-binding transcriptional regulator YhcF (GntR family)